MPVVIAFYVMEFRRAAPEKSTRLREEAQLHLCRTGGEWASRKATGVIRGYPDRTAMYKACPRSPKLRYHAQAYCEPTIGVRPDMFDLEATAFEELFQALDGVLVAVFGMNTFTLIKP